MNKTLLFAFLLVLLVNSCSKKNDKLKNRDAYKINAVSVIIDDQLWYGEVGDTLRNKLASPVIGLTKEEPLFTINQYSAKLLEGFMTNGRNVIIVKKDDANKFEVKKNQFSTPQNVFRIEGKSITSIIQLIEKNAPGIIQQIRKTEIDECQKNNAKALINPTLIRNKFHINLDVPSGFRFVMHKSNFLWLKKEMVGGNVSLLLYQIPLHSFDLKSDKVSQIVHMRDSIGMYIQGKELQTQMITDDAYSPYFQTLLMDGKKAFETRGTWKLQNDFMMGPFINYLILDPDYDRVLILEGFCYAPSNEERDLMLNLEAVLKSVQVIKRKEIKDDGDSVEN